jgi:hypothetical protein
MSFGVRRAVWLCLVVLSGLGFASGCSHQPRRIDCEGRLEPVNPPTPVVGVQKPNDADREP